MLINKFPSEREAYSRLVNEKEALMRNEIVSKLGGLSLRFESMKHPAASGLPDIDLAVIDDSGKACLILELKWFISPAETREIIEKSEEIAKGISQLLALKDAVADKNSSILEALKIDSRYEIGFSVVSANWIGHSDVQDLRVAVVNEEHFVRKTLEWKDLTTVMRWLANRGYLPSAPQHFEMREILPEIASWRLRWYGIRSVDFKAFERDC